MIFRLIPLLAIACINSCASNRPAVFSETFIATINDYNMRQFQYTLAYDLSAKQDNLEVRGPGERPGNGRDMNNSKGVNNTRGPSRDMGKKMRANKQTAALERIEELLSQSQYCKHGYFIIEKTFLQGSTVIFGECKAVVKH